jgi:hypothetical protein
MKNKSKVIAMYLPQYHCIPENDEFWGKGFTDWVMVRNARPLFEGHQQPRVPLNNNYYDLSIEKNVEWQAKLAKENGIYGFGVYHYWFNNEKNLLTKPVEILRDSQECNVKYFFVWDNCLWKRSWSNIGGNDWAPLADKKDKKNKGIQILIPYILGREPDWRNHYNYVRLHFKSKNYEKKENKPVFTILWYSSEIGEMCEFWDKLAKEDGFNGVFFIFKYSACRGIPNNAYRYNYEPHYAGWENISLLERIKNKILKTLHIQVRKDITFYDYDETWEKLLKYASNHSEVNLFHGAFVGYDDSPRRGRLNSIILRGASPEKFKKYFKELVKISAEQNKEYIFLTAWNEWGEGAYLEPDTIIGMKYLEAVKEAIK